MPGPTRDELIQAFHTRALALLDADDETGANRRNRPPPPGAGAAARHPARGGPRAAARRRLDGDHPPSGEDGRGALMLLRLPDDAPTPVHNHNTWGVARVIEGVNHYWRWERLDDLSDPNHADIHLAESSTTAPASTWSGAIPARPARPARGERGRLGVRFLRPQPKPATARLLRPRHRRDHVRLGRRRHRDGGGNTRDVTGRAPPPTVILASVVHPATDSGDINCHSVAKRRNLLAAASHWRMPPVTRHGPAA